MICLYGYGDGTGMNLDHGYAIKNRHETSHDMDVNGLILVMIWM